MKKNVAFVCNNSFSMYHFRNGLIKKLIKENYKVFIIAPKDNYSTKLQLLGCILIDIDLKTSSTNLYYDFLLLLKLISIYRKNKIEFIFHYTIKPNIYGSIAARVNNIPQIAITTGLGRVFQSETLLNYFIKVLYKISLKSARQVWFLNSDDKNLFVKNNIVKVSKTYILKGEGIDLEKYKTSETKTLSANTNFEFLLIARLIKSKGIEEYIKAAHKVHSKYPFTTFKILGHYSIKDPDAVSFATIKSLEHFDYIQYLYTKENIIPDIKNCNCVVLPSYYKEGVPRSLLEAAALQKPIITTDNVGCRDVVDDTITGYLVIPMDHNDLSKKMELIVNLSEKEREQMGRLARQKMIREFDEKIVINSYLNVLKKI